MYIFSFSTYKISSSFSFFYIYDVEIIMFPSSKRNYNVSPDLDVIIVASSQDLDVNFLLFLHPRMLYFYRKKWWHTFFTF
jgi:hypothetical protein